MTGGGNQSQVSCCFKHLKSFSTYDEIGNVKLRRTIARNQTVFSFWGKNRASSFSFQSFNVSWLFQSDNCSISSSVKQFEQKQSPSSVDAHKSVVCFSLHKTFLHRVQRNSNVSCVSLRHTQAPTGQKLETNSTRCCLRSVEGGISIVSIFRKRNCYGLRNL